MSDIAWFGIYGERGGDEDPGFLHIERMRDRARLLQGRAVPHAHRNLFQLMFSAAGNCVLEVDGRTHSLTAPCAVYIPGGAVHSITFDDAVTAGWVVTAAEDWLLPILSSNVLPGSLAEPAIAMFPAGSEPEANFGWLLRQLERTVQQPQAPHELVVQSLLLLLLTDLMAHSRTRVEPPATAQAEREEFQRFRELLEERFRDHWTVEQFAQAMSLSPAALNRLVQRHGGKTAHEMQQHRLLLEAQRLLIYTSASAVQIAAELGFQDPAYFSRFFKRHTGLTPL
ncbi:MAG: helix-turn-helix domain-containing protein, partial [Spongiibacteraceae bacterium]|nr:helix-turn-helix domain-containing protein [Spongiibacteraceae bacterium]